MDSDFLEQVQRMKLTTDKDKAITIHVVRRQVILEENSLSLIGKFLTTRPINLQAAKQLL